MHPLFVLVGLLDVLAKDPVPTANKVVAGWGAFALFIGGCLAVALLGRSLIRQLRRAQQAADAGVYDEEKPPRPPHAR